MARPRKTDATAVAIENKVTVSPYQILNAWIRDGQLNSPIPEELLNGAINQSVILYYFVSSPKFFVYINKTFNNFSIFSLNLSDILKLMKEIVYYTSYRPPYTPKAAKDVQTKLYELLKSKYPYYKNEEIRMIVDFIDNNDDIKDDVYEHFGLRLPKTKKNTKTEFKKKMAQIVTKDDLLNSL